MGDNYSMTRDTLTKIFLNQWNASIEPVNVEFYSRIWWASARVGDTSLRLTTDGYNFLINILELKAYEVPFVTTIEQSPQTLIFLSRYMDCPYYLSNTSITVFSEEKSMELYMFSDDIRKLGLMKATKHRNSVPGVI